MGKEAGVQGGRGKKRVKQQRREELRRRIETEDK